MTGKRSVVHNSGKILKITAVVMRIKHDREKHQAVKIYNFS
jgi:hypothetical protein